ncbi:MAG TPA: hypothetical protein VFP19_05065 [Candidatus Limnocylindrales bacterium]|nr:hypothetical protein [Candidatus Limnocylindrales bacterium]
MARTNPIAGASLAAAVVWAAALLVAGPGLSRAAPPPVAGAAPPPADRAFVTAVVAAINSGSVERRIALLHTKSLACVRSDSASVYRDMFLRQARRRIPAGYHFTIAAVNKGEAPPFSDLFQYPVAPTHTLDLTFDTGPGSSTTLVLLLAREHDRWREVVGCLKPGTAAVMRAAREQRSRDTRRAQDLAAHMAPALRDSVLLLFRQGRRIDAYQKYAAETGQDLAMAKEVVDILADRAHLPR